MHATWSLTYFGPNPFTFKEIIAVTIVYALNYKTYARFRVENNYFAINSSLIAYFTMSDNELMRCRSRDIKICLANKAVYSTDVNSFELSLYEGWNFNSGNYLFTTDTK